MHVSRKQILRTALEVCLLLCAFAAVDARVGCAGEVTFVDRGTAKAVHCLGKAWVTEGEASVCGGTGNFLVADQQIGPGDFRIRGDLTIENLTNSAASVFLGMTSHFGFEGASGGTFIQGPLFGSTTTGIGKNRWFPEGKRFLVEIERKGSRLTVRRDGELVWQKDDFTTDAIGPVGLRPWRSTMRVHAFEASGTFEKPAEQVEVYTSGEDGYDTYRIPSVIVTAKGTVLAFCEGRRNSRGDAGDIDIVLKRSNDGGRTFSEQQVVWDDGTNTCGNPCPVVDGATGTIWLLLTHNLGTDHERDIVAGKSENTRTVWVTSSSDDGLTWAEPVEITSSTKKPGWAWYATGPGCGIQTRSGRLVIPCDHIVTGGDMWSSHVIYSDDHGKTWQLGGTAPPKTNECEVVELSDGRLLLNMRNYNREHPCRAIAVSDDEGVTFSEVSYDETLIEPICQASIRRYGIGDSNAILFSNPAQTKGRARMTVRLSEDDCETWSRSRVLHHGPAAYSCLAVLPDGTILCLYERGWSQPYERITLARFSLEWMEL
jgi:sialidase-1